MLETLIKPSRKKIQKARTTYEIYCKVKSLAATREATGLGINTIRRYIALVESINNKNKLSTKDRYYNTEPIELIDSIDPIYNIYNNNNIYNKDNNINNINKDINKDIDNNNVENDIEIDDTDVEIITANKKNKHELKNKVLNQKLSDISFKYLGYLENATEQQLRKTSLKDHAVIAGILLDKKILLEHKSADVIKNQSIIFNLFGNNTNLSKFIASAMDRQRNLAAKPVKKYEIATNR